MNSWLAGHFFHPGFLAGGAALVALPVIIHLINRLRYRRVRFAAMEFLLQSQQRNRRRILLEQLLLLLMRMAIVAGIVMLISRLILDPTQMSLFRGAKAHHVILLDDSGSMRERWGETTAFREALGVVNQFLTEGAQRPDTQTFSLLRLSKPDQPFASQRDVNDDFVLEMATKLDPQIFQPTHQQVDLPRALRSALDYLREERGAVQHLHLISDFREHDWKDQQAIVGVFEELSSAGVTLNLVKVVPKAAPNLAVTELSAAVQVAAAGVPLRVRIGVTNFGDQPAKDVRVAVSDDGVKLPLNVVFDRIDAGETATLDTDIRLATPTQHRLSAAVDADALPDDNVRYLAVDVSTAVPVLIVDGAPDGEASAYVADALAADPASTGVQVTLDSPDGLRRRGLDGFRTIYLLNVPQLAPDAIESLQDYVRSGGGLVWFLGPAVRASHYNEFLHADGKGLFPVPLAAGPTTLSADPSTAEVDLVPHEHPLFEVLRGDDNPFLASVHVREFYPTPEGWIKDDQLRVDGTKTLASLRTGAPFILESSFGNGRVVACLSTADPLWNDWARNPSFVVFQLDLLKYIARRDRGLPLRTVGEPIDVALDPALYQDRVEIIAPASEGEQTTRLQATPATPQTTPTSQTPNAQPVESSGPPENLRLTAEYRDTDEPGIYRLQLLNQSQQTETRLLAYNMPLGESELELATTANLRKRISPSAAIQIQEPGEFQWLQGEEAGSEIRTGLLWLLLVLLLGEQLLAYRMSYHPKSSLIVDLFGGRHRPAERVS